MKGNKCNGCDKRTNNLLTANCGHKTCIQCIKIYKATNKCPQCSNNLKISKQRNISQEKESNKIKSQDISAKKDQRYLETTIRKNSKIIMQRQIVDDHKQSVYCQQHSEPFSMFCQSTKKIICAVCLYKKGCYPHVMPIKNAQDILRKQNKIQKQQSQIAISQVQNAYKICKSNRQIFQKSFKSHLHLIDLTYKNIEEQLKKLQQKNKQILTNFFTLKLAECDQICSDLQYLHQTLSDYKSINQQHIPLNQTIFVYESYRIIRKTLKTIDLNYYSYQKKQPKIMQIMYPQLIEKLNKLITFKLDLPLRKSQPKVRSMSARSPGKSTLNDEDNKNPRPRSKKDRLTEALSKNIQQQFDESLYKKMLRIRFKPC